MKNVIAGLEEGLQAIAEALESGGGGGNVPTPTLDDDGKVLRVVSQSQEEVAPEWSDSREVPRGGQNGQVLTRTSEGYGWAAPSGGLPALYEEDNGKVLMAQYDSDTENTYPAWSLIKQVPAGGTTGQVLTRTSGSGYGWATPSGGGGGNIGVLKIDVNKSDFSPSEGASGMYDAGVFISGALTKINSMIGITIVDNVDSGYPVLITPKDDTDCSIFYDSDMTMIRISSTIYNALGTRQAIHFYMTYYTGA